MKEIYDICISETGLINLIQLCPVVAIFSVNNRTSFSSKADNIPLSIHATLSISIGLFSDTCIVPITANVTSAVIHVDEQVSLSVVCSLGGHWVKSQEWNS